MKMPKTVPVIARRWWDVAADSDGVGDGVVVEEVFAIVNARGVRKNLVYVFTLFRTA